MFVSIGVVSWNRKPFAPLRMRSKCHCKMICVAPSFQGKIILNDLRVKKKNTKTYQMEYMTKEFVVDLLLNLYNSCILYYFKKEPINHFGIKVWRSKILSSTCSTKLISYFLVHRLPAQGGEISYEDFVQRLNWRDCPVAPPPQPSAPGGDDGWQGNKANAQLDRINYGLLIQDLRSFLSYSHGDFSVVTDL